MDKKINDLCVKHSDAEKDFWEYAASRFGVTKQEFLRVSARERVKRGVQRGILYRANFENFKIAGSNKERCSSCAYTFTIMEEIAREAMAECILVDRKKLKGED